LAQHLFPTLVSTFLSWVRQGSKLYPPVQSQMVCPHSRPLLYRALENFDFAKTFLLISGVLLFLLTMQEELHWLSYCGSTAKWLLLMREYRF